MSSGIFRIIVNSLFNILYVYITPLYILLGRLYKCLIRFIGLLIIVVKRTILLSYYII